MSLRRAFTASLHRISTIRTISRYGLVPTLIRRPLSSFSYHRPTPQLRTLSYSIARSIEMATSESGSAWKPSKPRGVQRESDHKTGPKGEPMTPLPSATLIVLCPRSSKDPKGQLQYDTLMVQRSARDGSSFRSAVVFPGGALDLVDEADVKAALTPSSTDLERYMYSLKLCALRETFEETGLLLLPSPTASLCGLPTSRAVGHQEAGMSAQDWAHARNDVHHNAVDFVPFLRKVTLKLGLEGLLGEGGKALPELAPMAHHSNWITPRSVIRPAKRFDAHFFITVLDTPDVFGSDKSLQISADGSETLSLRLQTPREIMYAGIIDQISLFPPQFYILADLETALRCANKENGRVPIIPLIFDPAQATPNHTPDAEYRVTPVEEEARGLHNCNYSWDRKDTASSNDAPLTSWVSDTNPPLSKIRSLGDISDSQYPTVTAVEPRPFPKLGAMLDIRKEIAENRDLAQQKGKGGEEDNSFVFPLVLPGDWQASPAQKERARKGLFLPGTGEKTANGPADGSGAAAAQGTTAKPLNRLYVSPRSKEQGGGMTVRGAVRKGLTHLRDFQVGVLLAENPEQEERNSKL
ncbi:uncharacterized protein MEPE_04462 [Melanopsichium pennsylvanicum]|uniref:Nudix hydrolase domain-containing protein n=2 Tax=Melanopsichium pennsylvanicum TaxID=63383 RepID=A0AAJ5C6P9_9BASI|nr:nudix hydrolase domain containing protein [Melanopsichium pennsylvanicum 4]SNX85753.1 uncharacterized protein MEPE_04462 [Melanopsichium pennsylvanicum]